MSKINDGGPAFPTHGFVQIGDNAVPTADGGMSLRDWFAGQALAGMLTYYNEHRGDYHTNATCDVAAKDAYAWADAMLAARAEGGAA
jgi:hypothetical protein